MNHNYTDIFQINNATTPSELAIWQMFKGGDRLAFEQLLHLFYPKLLSYGSRLIQDKTFAQDSLQDFFIDLWNHRQSLGNPNSVKAYLLASYRRKLFKEKGRNFWHRETTTLYDEYDIEVQLNIENYLISNEIEHETLLKLKTELDKLTKRQREALYLRFYEAMEYEEIAQSMEINHHSAVNLVYEAIKLLRKNWILAVNLLIVNFL